MKHRIYCTCMLLYGVGSEWDRRKCLGVVGFDHARISDHFSLMNSMVSGSYIHELWMKVIWLHAGTLLLQRITIIISKRMKMSLCDSALSPTVKEVQGIIDACESIDCSHVVLNPPGFILLKFCMFISLLS